MLSLIDYRFLKSIYDNLIENRDHFYILNKCLGFTDDEFQVEDWDVDLTEARKDLPPWVPPGKPYIAEPSPESIAKYQANPYKMIGDKKIQKRKPREGFQGVLLGGIENAKVAKSWKKGYVSLILNLSPAEESGFNLCSCRTKGCALACLHMSGSPVFQKAKMRSRLGNTFYLVKQRQKFIEQLVKEITLAKEYADDLGKKLAIRLNGTSDLPWESPDFGLNGKSVMALFPDVQFYDYTKVPGRMRAYTTKEMPKNYHLTFSYSERPDSGKNAIDALKQGGTVAIVFGPGKNQAREHIIPPKVWNGFKVVDGDESDLRFEDEKGVVVGLTAKADATWDFDRLTEPQIQTIHQILQQAGVKKVTTQSGIGVTSEVVKAITHPETLYKLIDVLRHGEKPPEPSGRGTGFVVQPEDPSVDPRKYPENLPYAIQGIQKKIARVLRGKDKRETYRQIRRDFFSKHSDLYKDYLNRIEKYCKEHPEECKDTDLKHIPLAKKDNPLSQAGIGITQPTLTQIGILPKDRKR